MTLLSRPALLVFGGRTRRLIGRRLVPLRWMEGSGALGGTRDHNSQCQSRTSAPSPNVLTRFHLPAFRVFSNAFAQIFLTDWPLHPVGHRDRRATRNRNTG